MAPFPEHKKSPAEATPFVHTSGHTRPASICLDSFGKYLESVPVPVAGGEIHALLLDSLEGIEMSKALHAYVRRAKVGAEDAALVTGTGKDLLEATAAHVIQEVYGSYSTRSNFPTLWGQVFAALQLKTSEDDEKAGEPPQAKMERGLFDLACGVNRLRNKQGTGHGRPFLPTVKPHQAKVAIEAMGVVAEYLLRSLEDSRSGGSAT